MVRESFRDRLLEAGDSDLGLLSLKTIITTYVAWVAVLFGFAWFVFGRAEHAPTWVYLAYLVANFGYIGFRTYAMGRRLPFMNKLSRVFLSTDTISLGFAFTVSGGTASPFLPIIFHLPVAGALLYGAGAGLAWASLGSVVVVLSSLAASIFFQVPFSPWTAAGYALFLPIVGLSAGALAERNERAVKAREQAEALAASERSMTSQLMARAIEAQEMERSRIARDLHDGVGPLLATAKLEATMIRQDASAGAPVSAESAERLRTLLLDALNDIRRLLFDLKPVLVEERGLAEAVNHLADRVLDQTGIAVSVECDKDLRLSSMIETSVFRCVQAALDNVARHSDAGSASVSLRCDGDALRVVVEDDGDGFSEEDVARRRASGDGGLGLQSIAERASALRGEVLISSSPGMGTRVAVSLPIE